MRNWATAGVQALIARRASMKRAAIARSACVAALLAGLAAGTARAQQTADYQGIPYDSTPLASVDLATHEGAAPGAGAMALQRHAHRPVAFYDLGAGCSLACAAT